VLVGDLFVYVCIAVLVLLVALRLRSGSLLIRETRRGIVSE